MFSTDDDGAITHGGADSDWHSTVMNACPSLREGCTPPAWARNTHIQNLLVLVRDRTAPAAPWDLEERLTMDDGGTVSIQWLGLDSPPDTPVLVVMHTICGSGDGLRRFILAMRESLGWVIAACNRRGHGGLDLTAPQINTMGSTSDLRRQLGAIEERRPRAELYGAGISAGSGLLVRYLGEEGARTPMRAGVALCPAYDLRTGFHHADPRYDSYLTRKMIDFFLTSNRDVLGEIEGFDSCCDSGSIAQFHDRIYALAGFDSPDAYYEGSNPMAVAEQVAIPMLVINSADDPVCVEHNVHEHIDRMRTLPQLTLTLTRRGGHCAFFEGPLASECWSERAIAEYLLAIQRILRDQHAAA